MITCPLLTLDLLWTLNLPYKLSYSFFVFLTLFSGFMSTNHPQPGRWMWFFYGLILFSFTWLRIIGLVQVRFLQYFTKKEKSSNASSDSQKRMSMATKSGLRDKSVRNPLQTALGTYFCIWMVYPVLWLLVEGDVISPEINHCCTVVMDVLAKSMYGFALLKFQLLVDKNQVHFSELKVTRAELLDEYNEAKKKIRKLKRQQEEESSSGEESDGEEYLDHHHHDALQQHAGSDGSVNSQHMTPGGDLANNTVSQEQIKMLMAQLSSSQMSPGTAHTSGVMSPPKMYDENTYMPGAGAMASHRNLASFNNRPPSPRLTPRGDGAAPIVGGWRSQQ